MLTAETKALDLLAGVLGPNLESTYKYTLVNILAQAELALSSQPGVHMIRPQGDRALHRELL